MFGERGLSGASGEASISDLQFRRRSGPALHHFLLDFGDRLAGVQSLRAGPGAVQDRVATIEPERVFQAVEPFLGRLVTGVGEPAPGLKKRGRTEKAVAVPPIARTTRRAAEAENAFIVAVEPAALIRRLKSFGLRFGSFGMKPGLDHLVLSEQVILVRNKVLDDR